MKRAIISLALCLLVLPAGCSPSASVSSAAPSGLPAAFEPPKDTQDFGEVTMLLYGYKTTLDDRDVKDQERILQAVSDALWKQNKVRMALKALPVLNPVKELFDLAAAGKPPEISAWLPKAYGGTDADKLKGTTLKPLMLDAALVQYGEHLRDRIDKVAWQQSTVKDHIMAIPMANATATTVPVLNQKVLQKYNWDVPRTAEEFDGLLAKAKEQHLMPVLLASAMDRGLSAELSMPYLSDSPAWYGLANVSVVAENGKLVPAIGSRQRLQWLRQQQLWATNRWVLADPDQNGNAKYISEGTWLCREIQAYNLNGMPDIVLLPPLGADGGTPGCLPPLYTSGGTFESYARPEAMVALLDWLCSDADNMKLISMGQKDIDYKEKADGTIVMDRRSWMGGIQFAMPGEKSQNPSTSPTAYDQAQQNARQFGGTYSNRDGIPDMAWQYRLHGSRLDTAGLKKDEYEKKVTESELQVLKGAKTWRPTRTLCRNTPH